MEFFQIDIEEDYTGIDVELYPYKPEAIARFNKAVAKQREDQRIKLWRVYLDGREFKCELLKSSLTGK
jgi:hypothetical protein